MFLLKKMRLLVVMLCVSLLFISCNGRTGDWIGAGLGAVTGCAIGLAAGGKAGGCIGGAAAGALAGWEVAQLVGYQDQQIHPPDGGPIIDGSQPVPDSVQVKILKGTSYPQSARPGERIKISTDYSIDIPPYMNDTYVKESWVLKKDGQYLTNLPPQSKPRTAGGWNVNATIDLPKEAEPGTYIIEHRVEAENSYDVDESHFVIVSAR